MPELMKTTNGATGQDCALDRTDDAGAVAEMGWSDVLRGRM